MKPVAMLCLSGKVGFLNPAEAGLLVLPAPSSYPGNLRHMRRGKQGRLLRPGVSGLLVQPDKQSDDEL